MLQPVEKDAIRLILRSPDRGDGWRTCSALVWSGLMLSLHESRPALIELDEVNHRVRLSSEGLTVAKYLILDDEADEVHDLRDLRVEDICPDPKDIPF